MLKPVATRRTFLAVAALATAVALVAPAVSAQTIRGRLLDADSGQPIDLGLVMMFTEAGDSVTGTVTGRDGSFTVSSPEPGSFHLVASAWGYRRTPAGVFELGEGGEMTVEFRVRPEPLPIDAIVVGIDQPVFNHKLVRQGFVDRFQRGLGHFITPHDIENSPAMTTEALFEGIPGVAVQHGASAYAGNPILMRSPTGGLCIPMVFVDGLKVTYRPVGGEFARPGLSMSTLVPLETLDAVEIYRRAAEIPVEYGVTQPPIGSQDPCGVIVLWTKSGVAPGRTAVAASPSPLASVGAPEVNRRLPSVDERGPPPTSGERIRIGLHPGASISPALTSPWEGTFVSVREREIVVNDASSGRPAAVPLSAVEALQVQRQRGFAHAIRRGAIAGSVFGLGAWLSLRYLCGAWCGQERDDARLPAALAGALVGLLVAGQGPGDHWVSAPLPEAGHGPPGARLPQWVPVPRF